MSDKDVSAAVDMARAVHEDKCATINGRDYEITSVTHKNRRKVFAFYSKVGESIGRGDFSFMDTDEWDVVEKTIENIVLFNGCLLSKSAGHWEEHPQDYITFVATMLVAISYPFFQGGNGS